MSRCLIDGNEAIAWGAVSAGCRFFAGYPITPATTILNTMLQLLPPVGGICLQGEDEIASIGYCLGASMAGMKAMTATSGPGISLYSEQISFAIGSEIPIVIVDIQRLGPSTGSATRGADGDIQFLQWGNSGGLPVIVLAPTNVADCYHLTIKAFELAEEFRCPVFVASNKEIGMTKESADVDFDIAENPPAFRVPSVGDSALVRKTSSTHGPDNYITTDPEVISETQERLKSKLLSSVERFTIYEEIIEPGSDTLLICYGVTARAAKAAAADLKAKHTPVSLLILKTLWPVLEILIREKAKDFKHVIVVEMNLGQYIREIRRVLGRSVTFFGQMNGKLITPGQIEAAYLLH
jgi:2-oxoglutarate ferredoxin oxidoreductase subunit alpha